MQRDEIESRVKTLLDAYERGAKSRTAAEHEAADAAGRDAIAAIAVDTLFVLQRIATALEGIEQNTRPSAHFGVGGPVANQATA